MLDIQRIRDNADTIRLACERKKQPADIGRIVELDRQRRAVLLEVEQLKSARNAASESIAQMKRRRQDASVAIAEMKRTAERIKDLDAGVRAVEEQLHELMAVVANVAHESVPRGEGPQDNVEIARWGEARTLDFGPRDHLQLGTLLDILDFPRGAKIAGAGFPVYKGAGALLERALINYMLDTQTRDNGYREIVPPLLVNRESAFGTGQLPRSEDQMYYIGEDQLFCIPTAEVPVTNLHRDELLDESDLPIRYCAYTPCLRREAGSYGKDTKGFLRVHQFNKVELIKFVTPEVSYAELESLRVDAEAILRGLGLYYRVVELCDADLSFHAAKCYDLEAWAPAEGKWLEVSSCSNFEDFQARRMNTRYRPASGGKPRFVHTLNGSGLATSRVIVALMETYQTASGTIRVPDVLRPYMGGMDEIGG